VHLCHSCAPRKERPASDVVHAFAGGRHRAYRGTAGPRMRHVPSSKHVANSGPRDRHEAASEARLATGQ